MVTQKKSKINKQNPNYSYQQLLNNKEERLTANRVPGGVVFAFNVQENFILVDCKDMNFIVNFL